MTRTFGILPLLLLALAGCTTAKVSYRDSDDPERSSVRGSIVLKALRGTKPEKLASGYEFSVERRQVFSGYYQSSSEAPTTVGDLDPGDYQVVITGRHIQPITLDVSVQAKKNTTIVLWVRNARRAAVVQDVAVTTGKVLICTILGVIYVFSGDDDDVVEAAPREGVRESKVLPGSAGKYRNPH